MDPCDPATLSKGAPSFPRVQQQHSGENRTPGKSKSGKVKGKGKKTQEDDHPTAPVRKLWYEARSPEGYTYYWHIETNGGCTFVDFFYFFARLPFGYLFSSDSNYNMFHFSCRYCNNNSYICFLFEII